MRLPRRVPWADVAELERVFTWIYNDSEDLTGRRNAVNRLAAWAQAVSLPQALDSTLGLLTAQLLDANSLPTTSLAKRHAYSAALVRFVNGLVDPLQLGAYARPIASLAQQLDLPSWLVELRHASTHEDLPSLEVLREGTRQSIAWLHDRYFLPTLYPARSTLVVPPFLRSVVPLLDQYKSLQKQIIGDTTLAKTRASEVAAIYRDIERWIGEAKVAAISDRSDGAFGSGASRRRQPTETATESEDEEDMEDSRRERWALVQLSEALCNRGALVPTSKKKRNIPEGGKLLPKPLLALWTPLLEQIRVRHPLLAQVLVHAAGSRLLAANVPEDGLPAKHDTSYDNCLAAWITWMVQTWTEVGVSRADTISWLLREVHKSADIGSTVKGLVSSLCVGYPELEKMVAPFASVIEPSVERDELAWTTDALSIMNKRLQSVLDALATDNSASQNADDETDGMEVDVTQNIMLASPLEQVTLPSGWSLLNEANGWQPAPMGVFVKVK